MDIRPEWPVVESIPFTSLAKLNFTVGQPEDIAFCGALEYYDKVYDRVTPKADRPLKRTNKVFKSVTTSDDPVIRYGTLLHPQALLAGCFVSVFVEGLASYPMCLLHAMDARQTLLMLSGYLGAYPR